MLNKIMLIGNLGRDPEMSYTQSGQAVTKFSLAASRSWKDRQSGEQKKETTWFNIVAWGDLGERCNQFLHKGSKVYVEGRMTSHKYTDKDGVERTAWDVTLNDMQMLDPREQSGGGGAGMDEVPVDDIPF